MQTSQLQGFNITNNDNNKECECKNVVTKQFTIPPVITIDGPTSSGKGTIGKLLARKLEWHFLDSGVLYRILALVALQNNIDVANHSGLEKLALDLKVEFIKEVGKPQQIIYNGYDVASAIRQEGCGSYASELAVIQEVRDALSKTCQQFRKFPGLVADGRDMGTVVFPDAELKIFLTASEEARAMRRWQQLQNKGINVSLADVTIDLRKRDQRDSQRAIAPLKPAVDSVIVDTTNEYVSDTLKQLLALCSKKFC